MILTLWVVSCRCRCMENSTLGQADQCPLVGLHSSELQFKCICVLKSFMYAVGGFYTFYSICLKGISKYVIPSQLGKQAQLKLTTSSMFACSYTWRIQNTGTENMCSNNREIFLSITKKQTDGTFWYRPRLLDLTQVSSIFKAHLFLLLYNRYIVIRNHNMLKRDFSRANELETKRN